MKAVCFTAEMSNRSKEPCYFMDEFKLYEILCATEAVVAQYSAGKDMLDRIGRVKEAVSTRRYRLAVVGEFKTGKSSLINALVGSNLLPTNILPTTAVVNRIIFGESKQIMVCYKNGTIEKRTVEELENYATKLDEQKEEQAAQIKEIIIEYPSVFCQNKIEIIDTPGLNDDEQMSAVTLGVLDEIDSVIMTISANIPLDLTERDLIMTLLEQKGIRHITFVITFIDQISNRKSEQDKIIEFIKKRIQKEILPYSNEYFNDQPELIEKARLLLQEPAIFGVSSVLALKGFDYDDPEILQESRFPTFKQILFDLLTADQSADIYAETMDCVHETGMQLEYWNRQQMDKLQHQYTVFQKIYRLQQTYFSGSEKWLQEKLIEMEHFLQRKGFNSNSGLCEDLAEQLCYSIKRLFIKTVSTIRRENLSEQTIRNCLQQASKDALEMMSHIGLNFEKWIQQEMSPVYNGFSEWRVSCGLKENCLKEKMDNWKKNISFPAFGWCRDVLLTGSSLLNVDIITMEEQIIRQSLLQFGEKISSYLASWRRILLQQNIQDRSQWKDQKDLNSMTNIKIQLNLYNQNLPKNQKILNDCENLLNKEKKA